MNVTVDEYGTIIVILSRRNLQTLLLKLDVEDSMKTLTRATEGGYLMVVAEENDIHYGDRTPGPMHPREEEKL